jgi:hypothetical protein
MRLQLSNLLLEIHFLLRDERRDRGALPGPQLERDVEWLTRLRGLSADRRIHWAPFNGTYYSGLQPETDVCVYHGPQFLQIEVKDTKASRLAVTDLWARALDLHLGNSLTTHHPENRCHYVVLVVSRGVDDRLRTACLRWGINLVEPFRLPLHGLPTMVTNHKAEMNICGCSQRDLEVATLPFNLRFPSANNGVLIPYGRLRNRSTVESILKFQELVTNIYHSERSSGASRRAA